ncbi:MAG: hypothetical protein LBP82_00325 [Candidatus Methanoplasma sp.]|nr:hypothetical protein [Candidatus Methanoplasma sp.]
MENKNRIQKDRSGIGTIAVVLIVVIVIAAAAAVVLVYFVGEKDQKSMAPGTTMEYDLLIDEIHAGTIQYEIVGQNADAYFTRLKMDVGTISFTEYGLNQKKLPDDAVKKGRTKIDALGGKKTVDIWEYTYEGRATKSYIGISDGLSYRDEITMVSYIETHVLTACDLKWQNSYNESGSIGTAYEYMGSFMGVDLFSATITCIADCLNDQYGVVYSSKLFYLDTYRLSEDPQGLPVEATYTGVSIILKGTIDGDVSVGIWEFFDAVGYEWTFYYEPGSHIIYKCEVDSGSEVFTFVLTDKP